MLIKEAKWFARKNGTSTESAEPSGEAHSVQTSEND